MKSAIASLRSLTLPFGATSGARIVLDGVNGVIRIYDTNGNLALELTPEILTGIYIGEAGFIVYDDAGNHRILMSAPPALGAAGIDLDSGSAAELANGNGGTIAVTDTGGLSANFMQIHPGDTGHGTLRFNLISANSDNSGKSFMQVEVTLDIAALKPYIDLSGTSAPSAQQRPDVIVSDLYYGTPGASVGIEPTRLGQYPRGIIAIGENASDVVLSTTAGTFTQIVESDSFDVVAGEIYRVEYTGGDNLLIGGSGFGLSDSWWHKFQRSVGGGAYGDGAGMTTPKLVARLESAAGTRKPIPSHTAYYYPAGSASVKVRLVATKAAGAATVTSTYTASSGLGTAPHRITVEHIGQA